LAPLKGKDQKAVPAAKQAAGAEQKRKEAEERKAAQLKVEEEKRAAVAAAAAEQRRQVAAETRRKVEEKQAAAAEAAEAKRMQAEERAAISAAASRARDAEKLVSRSVPGATINLGALFGFGGNDSSEAVPTGGPASVPVISDWKQNADGSITGKISGKSGFRLGEAVTTSPVPKGAVGGRVVTTSSGSK
jgi:membrane protein involved in colicin uptake